MTMTGTKQRIAALLVSAVVAATGAFVTSATVAADEAHAKVKWVVGPEV
jgi:hypothetical protein